MRDLMSWSFFIYRAFNITVRVHLFFLIFTLPLCGRQLYWYSDFIPWYDIVGFSVLVLFGSILLHEYGHCFGARWTGGTADEILIWPLGGLAYCSPVHHWKAYLITTLAGPAVNVALWAICGLMLAAGGFLVPLNPIAEPYAARMYSFRDGKTWASQHAAQYYRTGTTDPTAAPVPTTVGAGKRFSTMTEAELKEVATLAVAPTWAIWAWRIAWVNMVLFLFNMLIPGYPMDCGRVVQEVLWWRTGDYRQSTITACYVGYFTAFVLFAIALFTGDVMFSGLSFFIFFTCYQTLMAEVNADAGAFGYDFSAGYTSLEKDDPPPPRPKKLGPIKSWLAARRAKKIAREAEEKARDEERMDQLLDKIAKSGKQSLTDEERRFMERVSARYRNRS